MPASRTVIGVGNPFRSDDGLGPRVARLVRDAAPPDCDVHEASGEGTQLMSLWADAAHVILIDAVRSGDEPGRIIRIDAMTETVPSDFFHYSTHAFSVAEAIEMSRALGKLPPRVVIFGVVGASFASGESLSPAVEAQVPTVAQAVIAELRA